MSLEIIKQLRERTGAGIIDVKKALEEADGDQEKAIEILRKKGADKAVKKADREAAEGVIGVYLHSNGKVASMVKLMCETDFVAKNEDFQNLAKDIAMHVAAMNPGYLKPEDVEIGEIEKEKDIWEAQLSEEGKSGEILEKALLGKENKYRQEMALMTQTFVKNPDITIEQLIAENVGKIGENIYVDSFKRFEI